VRAAFSSLALAVARSLASGRDQLTLPERFSRRSASRLQNCASRARGVMAASGATATLGAAGAAERSMAESMAS
jgi:hypothetical protein